MIEIQNYAPFIQLAVAFDFACVKFGDERKKIQEQISNLATFGKKLIDKHREKINPYIESIEKEILKPHLVQSRNKLKTQLLNISNRLESLKKMNAYYLAPVSLLSGLYSIIALLLIGEIDKYDFLLNTYTYFTELIFIIILFFVCLEWGANYKSINSDNVKIHEHIYLIVILLFFLAIFLSLFMSYKGYNIGTIPISFTNLSRCSLIIPFVSFLGVLFWLISFFIISLSLILLSIYVRWYYRGKIVWYNIEDKMHSLWNFLFEAPRYTDIKIVTSEKFPLPDVLKTNSDSKVDNVRKENSVIHLKKAPLKSLRKIKNLKKSRHKKRHR